MFKQTQLRPLRSMKDLAAISWPEPWYSHIYEIEVEGAPISLPGSFQKKVKQWLGEDNLVRNEAEDSLVENEDVEEDLEGHEVRDEDLELHEDFEEDLVVHEAAEDVEEDLVQRKDEDVVQKVAHQAVIEVTNRLTNETTMYNPLRASKPTPGSQANQNDTYAKQLIKFTRPECNFCQPERHTAEEVWGRIRTAHSMTAANVFKTAGPYSGLVLSHKHDPFTLGLEDLHDMFECAREWFQQVRSTNANLTKPMMIWDTLPKGGASQVHPHFQVWLNRNYHGQHRVNLDASLRYHELTGRNYWSDLVQMHVDLGLGIRFGEAAAIVPLTSHKDHEVMIIAEDVNDDFVFLLHAVLTMYNEDLGVFCRSLGMSWPSLPPTTSISSTPSTPNIHSTPSTPPTPSSSSTSSVPSSPSTPSSAFSPSTPTSPSFPSTPSSTSSPSTPSSLFSPSTPFAPSSQYLPAIAKIGGRGDCSSVASDVSALELYSFYVINVNPIHTINTLKNTLKRLNKRT